MPYLEKEEVEHSSRIESEKGVEEDKGGRDMRREEGAKRRKEAPVES